MTENEVIELYSYLQELIPTAEDLSSGQLDAWCASMKSTSYRAAREMVGRLYTNGTKADGKAYNQRYIKPADVLSYRSQVAHDAGAKARTNCPHCHGSGWVYVYRYIKRNKEMREYTFSYACTCKDGLDVQAVQFDDQAPDLLRTSENPNEPAAYAYAGEVKDYIQSIQDLAKRKQERERLLYKFGYMQPEIDREQTKEQINRIIDNAAL